MENLGLIKEDIDKIKAVFSHYEQVEEVVIYGSRAKGTYKPASDIDLTLIGDNIDLSLQLEIEFELDDLMLPYRFDITIFRTIENPSFIEHITRVGKIFHKNIHPK